MGGVERMLRALVDPYFLFSPPQLAKFRVSAHIYYFKSCPQTSATSHTILHIPSISYWNKTTPQLKQASGVPHALSYKTQSTVLRSSSGPNYLSNKPTHLSPPSVSKTSATPDANRSLNTGQPGRPLGTCHVSHLEAGCLPPTRLFLQITSRPTLPLEPY